LRGNGGKELSREEGAAALGAPQAVSQSDMAIQTGGDGGGAAAASWRPPLSPSLMDSGGSALIRLRSLMITIPLP